MPAPLIESFFDSATSTLSHLVLDPETGQCALVDSVLDYQHHSGRLGTNSAQRLLDRVEALGATVQWVLDTHLHADHLSASAWLAGKTGARLGIGREVVQAQQYFGHLFNAGPSFRTDGSQFDRLFDEGDRFLIGKLQVQVWHTPGHTPACMTYVLDEAAFVGDTFFAPDFGTARCDFPGGDATTLYRSLQRLLSLPPRTRLYLCHDYRPGDRAVRPWVSGEEQKNSNIHLLQGRDEATFVAFRNARDRELAAPALLLPSVQVNMRAGHLPDPEDNGMSYLKIPLRQS